MKCTQCNSTIRTKGALFCPYCGAKLPQGEQGTVEDCVAQQTCPKTNDNNRQIDAENKEIERKCVEWLKVYDRLVIECNNIQGQLTRSFNRLSYIKRNDIVDCQRQQNLLPALAFTRKAELKQKISDLESEMAAEEKKQPQMQTEINRLERKIDEVYQNLIQYRFGVQWLDKFKSLNAISIYDSEFGYRKAKIKFGWGYDHYTKSYKDIEWSVLEVHNDRILVISDLPIDFQPFDTSGADNITWETCTLRKWLNNAFFNNAFSDCEKSLIRTVSVPAEVYEIKTNYMGAGNSTQDKIFMLNLGEAKKYAGERITINQRQYTDYSSEIYSPWWLRSPKYPFKGVAVLDQRFGNYYHEPQDFFPVHKRAGVRPAMWINKHFES